MDDDRLRAFGHPEKFLQGRQVQQVAADLLDPVGELGCRLIPRHDENADVPATRFQ